MVVATTQRTRRPSSFPSGLMRRLGYEDAQEGRTRQHGSREYDEGYQQGLKDSGRPEA